jgi:hypothetical protein
MIALLTLLMKIHLAGIYFLFDGSVLFNIWLYVMLCIIIFLIFTWYIAKTFSINILKEYLHFR